jgi:hypothetical protein
VPSVAEFVQDEATTTIKLSNGRGGSIDIEVTYCPSEMTPEQTVQMQRRDNEGDTLAFVRLFAEIVKGWDLEGPLKADVLMTDDKGNPILSDEGNEVFEKKTIVQSGETIPVEVDILKYMTTPTLVGIWRELIQEQNSPDPQRSRGSRRR